MTTLERLLEGIIAGFMSGIFVSIVVTLMRRFPATEGVDGMTERRQAIEVTQVINSQHQQS